METLALIYAALLGLVFGSFLNAAVHRIPAGHTLMTRSACPKCGHLIRSRHNIPLVSWLLLRGRCKDCANPISWRYPAVELLTAAGFTYLAWRFQMWPPDGRDIILLVFWCASIALALIDLDTQTLPDKITLPLLAVTSIGLSGWFAWRHDWAGLAVTGACAAGYWLFFLALWWFTKGRGIGYGDVKLAPTLGAITGAFGVSSAAVGLAASFALGGLPLALLMAAGVVKRGTAIPFGPFLLAGAWVGVLWGGPLTAAYLSVAGLV